VRKKRKQEPVLHGAHARHFLHLHRDLTLDKTQIIVKYSNIAETYITSLPRLLFSSSHAGAAVKSGEGTALTQANNYNRNKKWKQSNVNRIRML
jgi:hypothetical protein